MIKNIHLIAAARPDFIKVAPLYYSLKKTSWGSPILVHTGTPDAWNMSSIFFKDLELPEPGIHLGVGDGSHCQQTGQVMMLYEKAIAANIPDLVIVVGDVDSTMAATITAVKVGAKVAHLEAGLRSFDRTMPEEINRLVSDSLADLLWTPSPDADENLYREGISQDKICRVGNIIIDSLEMMRSKIQEQQVAQEFHIHNGEFALITLHHPTNVDNPGILKIICDYLVKMSHKLPLIFPVHPRTYKNLEQSGLLASLKACPQIRLLEPQNYVRFMNLVFHCRLMITDSGRIQEVTSYLGIPCLTLRPNTARPITITQGTNRLCRLDQLEEKVGDIIKNPGKAPPHIEQWDGQTTSRVITSIQKFFHL